jgi:hypothetical protein
MAGPEGIDQHAVVFAARILVADEQGDRRAGRHPFEDSG